MLDERHIATLARKKKMSRQQARNVASMVSTGAGGVSPRFSVDELVSIDRDIRAMAEKLWTSLIGEEKEQGLVIIEDHLRRFVHRLGR